MLAGEGEVQYARKVRTRRDCDNCGEPATKRLTYCLINGRRNPASSMYGRDDCTFCADAEAFACDTCEREVERACCPDGMDWGGTFSAGGRYDHLFLYWVESDRTAAVAELISAVTAFRSDQSTAALQRLSAALARVQGGAA